MPHMKLIGCQDAFKRFRSEFGAGMIQPGWNLPFFTQVDFECRLKILFCQRCGWPAQTISLVTSIAIEGSHGFFNRFSGVQGWICFRVSDQGGLEISALMISQIVVRESTANGITEAALALIRVQLT